MSASRLPSPPRTHTAPRETAVNRMFLARLVATSAALLALPAHAEKFGSVEVVGFAKSEVSFCDNCSMGLVNPSAFDPRGVLNPPEPMLNQGGLTGHRQSNLGLAMLAIGWTHEFDNAWSVEGHVSARIRNNKADIFGNWVNDFYAGVSHPRYGSLQAGTMTTRTWTRSDSFAYPIGLSVPWAESGAGYGMIPVALRYATREYEVPLGKIRFEATLGGAVRRDPLNPSSTTTAPPSPRIGEVFIQYSNARNLVELMYQGSRGGRQSSFSKGAFYGAQGDTNGANSGYQVPTENVLILEGTYWYNDQWKLNYGVKRNEWSGQQQQCDYGPTSPIASACFWDQPGFNYWSDQKVHHAIEWDAMLGIGYRRGLYTYTVGAVRMNKAYVHLPSATEWGQNNTATFFNLGVYRKVPEVYKNLEMYAGIGRVQFGRQGPAPLSMPSNTADGNVDPRISKSGNSLTLGANILF